MKDQLSIRRNMMSCRYRGDKKGHYESYFFRANHVSEPNAFWVRYTIFSPKNRPKDAIGELWVIYFDGESVTAAKEEFPIAQCAFSKDKMSVRIADARVEEGEIMGSASSSGNTISWKLNYEGANDPVFLLPSKLYQAPLPKAKAVVGNPNVFFNGDLEVNGKKISVDQWQGSENHNWGSKHTDTYAWGQVSGFDNAPDSFFECASAKLKIGPVWTPMLTNMVLRHNGRDYALNDIKTAVKAKADWGFFHWEFESKGEGFTISGHIKADKKQFVGLNYYNPPKGSHTCLNCKIAACELILKEVGKEPQVLTSKNRAAFEILTDEVRHGVAVVA